MSSVSQQDFFRGAGLQNFHPRVKMITDRQEDRPTRTCQPERKFWASGFSQTNKMTVRQRQLQIWAKTLNLNGWTLMWMFDFDLAQQSHRPGSENRLLPLKISWSTLLNPSGVMGAWVYQPEIRWETRASSTDFNSCLNHFVVFTCKNGSIDSNGRS